mgnify:CR=1 FL=1
MVHMDQFFLLKMDIVSFEDGLKYYDNHTTYSRCKKKYLDVVYKLKNMHPVDLAPLTADRAAAVN